MKTKKLDPSVFVRNAPCVTICMNTPGYQSDNSQFYTEFNRLVDQAKFLTFERYGTFDIKPVIEKLDVLAKQISFKNHTKSLTIYIEKTTTKIIFSIWPVARNRVQVSDRFDIRPLIAIANNTEEYNILLLSHKKVKLLNAVNNEIVHEIKGAGFPVTKGLRMLAPKFKSKDEEEEQELHDFFLKIDSTLIKLYNANTLRYVVASSSDNYERFREIIRFQSLYIGHISINNDLTYRNIASEAWALIQEVQKIERIAQIKLVKELENKGEALTCCGDIIKAVFEGKGDLLIVNDTGQLADEDENIVCDTVWDVASKHGKVVLAEFDEVEDEDTMMLKLKW